MKLSELLALQPNLDLEVDLEPEAVVTEAVLLLRDVRLDDRTDALGFWTSEGTTGIIQYGLVCSAKLRLEQLMIDPENQ